MGKVPAYVGPDGIQRKREKDHEISLIVAEVLGSVAGQALLKYLRSITVEMVNGPNISNDELRHIEGQRYIVGLLETRIQHAHRIKTNE